MSTSPKCAVCGEPAKRKCTRCGGVFCDLHIRYGNPHFALGSMAGGTGYYCDRCWEAYRREARVFLVVLALGLIVVAFAFLFVVWGR